LIISREKAILLGRWKEAIAPQKSDRTPKAIALSKAIASHSCDRPPKKAPPKKAIASQNKAIPSPDLREQRILH